MTTSSAPDLKDKLHEVSTALDGIVALMIRATESGEGMTAHELGEIASMPNLVSMQAAA